MRTEDSDFSFKDFFIPFTTTKAINFIIIIGLIVFCNGLFNGFVGDDQAQITNNPVIQSLQNIPIFFSGSSFYAGGGNNLQGVYYKPIMLTLFSMIYGIFGSSAFIFHLIQIILFIINACLLYFILSKFFKRPVSLVLSLIFLVHPINSEVAFYISALQDVLFFFFGSITFLIFQRFQSQKAFMLAGIFLLCSLLSKETGILFALISLIYVFMFKRIHFYSILGYVSFISVIYGILRVHAVGFNSNYVLDIPISNLSTFDRLLNIPSIFLFYIKTFIFPKDLATSYHWVYMKVDYIHFFLPLLIDLFFLAIIFCLGYMLFKKYLHKYSTLYVFFTCWFLIGMLLHLQLFPIDQTVAERWFYFPSVGIIGMTGVLLDAFRINLKSKWIFFSTIVIIVILSLRSFVRSFDWRNELDLVRHDITVSKEDFSLENRLSYKLLQDGNYQEAMVHAKKSITLYPNWSSYTTLGLICAALGQYDNAKAAYIKASTYHQDYQLYENIAGLALVSGDTKKNISFIKSALQKFPQDSKLWLYLAIIQYKHGNVIDAKTAITQAYKFDQSTNMASFYSIIMREQPLKFDLFPVSN